MSLPKVSIGLAMTTLNEESLVPAAIAQFYSVVEDIVVVDGGSKDGTLEWCERLGARIIEHPFEDDFSAQKNRAIAALDTDWVYLTDPDERLEPTILEILPLLVTEPGQELLARTRIICESAEFFDCFGIARRNYIDGVVTETYPDYQYRLFKNYCRYEKPVHEEIINFEKRTEVDFERDSFEEPSRFNILHYKSQKKQDKQNAQYECIVEEKLK